MSFGTGNSAALEEVGVLGNAAPALNALELLSRAYQAVQAVDWPKARLDAERETPEPVLRTVLTYCYAAGILSSVDIEAACRHDPVVRYICANDFPSWTTIREFRRRNLPWIASALKHLFETLEPADHMPEARFEAERRLARAIQADSNAMDD
jgi:hypothetical protein